MTNDSIYKSTRSVPAGKMEQLAYTEKAKAKKTMDCLVIPDKIIADATTAQLVGKGNLCRIEGTSGGFIAFGTELVGIPSSSTPDTIKTPASFFLVVATDDYIRTSAIMRVEVTND